MMIPIARYGLGSYGGALRTLGEIRKVYEYRGATVYIDLQWATRWAEVFAYIGTGMLWFVAGFSVHHWAHAEQKAQQFIDEWIEEAKSDGRTL